MSMKKFILEVLLATVLFVWCLGCNMTPMHTVGVYYQPYYVPQTTYYGYYYSHYDYFWSHYCYAYYGFYCPPHYWYGHRHNWNGWHDYYRPPYNGWNQQPYGDRYKSGPQYGNERTQIRNVSKPMSPTKVKVSPTKQPRKKK